MLTWTLIFAAVSVVAGLLGFGALSGIAAVVARVVFGLFLFGLLVTVLMASCGYVAWTG